ncbi:hypothetical protein BDZ94DRAFT_1321699 [Collybia nuda]|uniref:Septation protein imp2 n=1 Tax=Collybia nuda TaxID=64659 RepID=A0A9P6CK73_9AGAR|nr:hypothetical protein BDZ94DRAFT_1321699 [Collybia nuda]
MATRRQPSTTSLSKYYGRATSPGFQNRSLDFCNAFWGIGDGGVDVLFARMRGATRTIEELKNFWKERSAIEEDYAKRLAKLAKMTLGRDEIGELRSTLDTVRAETDKQAGFHLTLAQQIRADLEAQTNSFHVRQLHHKKTFQAGIEKEFKSKQQQEAYVNKAREKYEADCVRINSYTAQSSLVQGKDLEKINLKLERAQQTVQANERDFANFAKAVQDTTQKWEQDWKAFCDSCQDLEESRMEFMKDNMWAYANAVSTVCVSDDESCEKMRLSLEQMEPEREMENFVRDYGTGNQIPDPPAFVNYNTPDAIPSSSSRPTSRPAQFPRSSQREVPLRQPPMSMAPDEPEINTAGVGAGGGARWDSQSDVALARQPTQGSQGRRASGAPPQQPVQQPQPQINGSMTPSGTSPGPSLTRQPTSATQASRQSYRVPPQDPLAETIDPTAETYIKVGNNAYKVDPSKDPQTQNSLSNRNSAIPSPSKQQNTPVDPLAKHMEDLKNAVNNSGSVRRKSFLRQASPQDSQPKRKSTMEPATGGPSSLSLPSTANSLAGNSNSQSTGPPPVRDYRNSAELVVGVHPSASRPASPNPPTAAFMVPKPAVSPSGSEVIEGVLTDYHQSLPGERKSISRSNSINNRGSFSGRPMSQSPSNAGLGHGHSASLGQNLARPPSQVGHPGIGAHGSRSNSPQPQSVSRDPSPAPAPRTQNNYIPQPSQSVIRSASPNTVGITLDPSGRVLHDEMAQRYQQQQQQQQQHQQQQQQQRPPQQLQQQQPQQPLQQQLQHHQPPTQQPAQYNTLVTTQRRQSYMAPTTAPVHQSYAITPPPPPTLYQAQAPLSSRPGYTQVPPVVQQQEPQYNPPPQTLYQPPPQQQTVYQPQPHANGYQGVNGLQRGASMAAPYYTNGAPPQQQHQQQMVNQRQLQPQQTQLGYGYRDPSPVGRSPSPQPPPPQQSVMAPPTGQTTEEGHGILFYVKALYDYAATIDEEFDFQAGDIIAVTATPEDGWWSGELLDEERRQKGRHVFPSNFVCLF